MISHPDEVAGLPWPMYLPNNDLQPTGSEITEFIDVPPMAETPPRPTAPSSDTKEPPRDSTRRPSG